MKTPITRAIGQTERWIDSIDVEKDSLAITMAEPSRTVVERAFCGARLDLLEQQRADAVRLLDGLRAVQYRPELMFTTRPRILKAPLRRAPTRRLA